MTFTAQLDDLSTTLRRTRSRLLAPIDHRQHQLPTDPEVFVEDVLLFVMDQWAADLREQGHVLEEDDSWKDAVNHYPHYVLRMTGGEPLDLHFTGAYPDTLHLTISKAGRRLTQFSDAHAVQVTLRPSMDHTLLLNGLVEGLKRYHAH